MAKTGIRSQGRATPQTKRKARSQVKPQAQGKAQAHGKPQPKAKPQAPGKARPRATARATAQAMAHGQPLQGKPRRRAAGPAQSAAGYAPPRGDAAPPPHGTPRERAYSWFPGHMLKAQQRLAEEVKQVDVVLEVRDARLPRLSGNPELGRLVGERKRLILLNKASLADPAPTAAWARHFAAAGLACLVVDADSGSGLAQILGAVAPLVEPRLAAYRARGIRPPPPRLMVLGMPNVGKSTLINRLVHSNRQRVAPMPGVTRHLTWVTLGGRYLLLDTPGVMLPRIATEADALALGWIGTIKDAVLGPERLATALLTHILAHAPERLRPWYPDGVPPGSGGAAALEHIGRHGGFLAAGATVNRALAAEWLLGQFREGKLGRFTLEAPGQGQ